MNRPLTALDSTFLELEDADPTAHMHVGAALLFGPGEDGAPPHPHAVARHVARRVVRVPRFREVLTRPDAGTLRRPEWTVAETFDPRDHVTERAIPAPGGQDELETWLGRFFASRLDRRRPLWEIAFVTGLEGDDWALVSKIHHCLADGMGGVAAGDALLDLGPDGPPAPVPAPSRPRGERSGTLGRVVDLPWRAARASADLALHPRRLVAGARSTQALAELLLHDELDPAPASSLNASLDVDRRFLVWEVRLAELDAVRAERGGTRNDVLLALVTAGLRAALTAGGEPLPEGGLRAMVPVVVRERGERGDPGNRISSMFVSLPVAEPEPERRFAAIRRETHDLKASGQPAGGKLLLRLADPLPPLLHSAVARSLFGTRLFNLTVTNVPGPREARYALGCPLRAVYPLVPLAADHALGIAALSYHDHMYVGLVADRARGGVLAAVRDGLETGLRELPPAVGSRPR